MEHRYILEKSPDNAYGYIDSYNIFIRCLYVSGVNMDVLESFLINYNNGIKEVLLSHDIEKIDDRIYNMFLVDLILILFLHLESKVFNEISINILECIDLIVSIKSRNEIEDRIVFFYNYLNGIDNNNNNNTYKDPLLRSLLNDEYEKFCITINEYFLPIKLTKKKDSVFFLERSFGFCDFFDKILINCYDNMYKILNFPDGANLSTKVLR